MLLDKNHAVIIILLPALVLTYMFNTSISCPDRSHMQLRSQGLCIMKKETKSIYTCLEDVFKKTFNESCDEHEDFVRAGYRYVLKGSSTIGNCSTDRYQPIIFYKSTGSMCMLLKSTCTEVGQIVARSTTGIADTTCICDYTEGYAYVTRPRNGPNCVPSEEDCSCYVNMCPENSRLSANNECIPGDAINMTEWPNAAVGPKSTTTPAFTAFNESPTRVQYAVKAAIFVTVIIVILFTEYFPQAQEEHICIEGEDVIFNCEALDDNQTAKWFKGGTEVVTSDRYKVERHGKLHRLVINNAKLVDGEEFSVRIKNCVRQFKLTVQKLPTAFHQLTEEDKGHYLESIKSGKETRYYIRIVIIGENGVGKTCLLRRLLGESIEDVKSTDGIDVVHRCKIRLCDGQYGQWIIDKDTDQKRKDIMTRINKSVNANTSEDKKNQQDKSTEDRQATRKRQSAENKMVTTEPSTPSTDDRDKMEATKPSTPSTDKKDIMVVNKQSTIRTENRDEMRVSEQSALSSDQRQGNSEVFSLQDNKLSFSASNQSQTGETKMKTGPGKFLTDDILNELSQFINRIEKHAIPNEVMVDLGFWDFAGEKEYYPTHQIFLHPNALHLLVTDITKDIKKINTEVVYDQIGEYIDFWFDSIHSCRDVEDTKNYKGDRLNPPVIVVCTGIDKCKDKFAGRDEEFSSQLSKLLGSEDKRKHLRHICHISNTEPSDKDLDDVRQSIFKFGKDIETYGEELPLKWIRLEEALDIVYRGGVSILSSTDMADLASRCSIDEEELSLFLKYHHKIGNIIYFESLKEHIILNHKWLADALKCFIADADKYNKDLKLTQDWKTLEETGELKPSLIVQLFQKEPERQFYKHKDHLLEVMEMFGIIFKPKDEEKQSYYMPCMISNKKSIEQIYEELGVKRETCTRTPWLCIQFDFMPLDFFNHILLHYTKKYTVCTFGAEYNLIALYHGKGVFYLDKKRFIKFILCFSKNTIGMQIWQWEKLEKGKCKSMLEELKSVIRTVKDKCEHRRIKYYVKSKCADGMIDRNAGRIQMTDLKGKEYFCEEHNVKHDTREFFQTWFEESSQNIDMAVEEENFIRILKLVSGVAPKAVEHTFDKYFPPVSLTSTLKNELPKLKALQTKKRLTTKQMALLFPTTGVTSSSSYDITLMICVLGNLTTIRHPVNGFDMLPPSSEIHEGADLARVNYYRNKIANSEIDRLSKSEFTAVWNDLEQAIIRLGDSNIKPMCDEIKQAYLSQDILLDIRHDKRQFQTELMLQQEQTALNVDALDNQMTEKHASKQKTTAQIEEFTSRGVKQKIARCICHDSHEFVIEEWEQLDELFVKTHVVDVILKKLETNHCITVTGKPGMGKSAIIHHIALLLNRSQGYTIVPCTSPQEIITHYKKDHLQVFVFDDVCGRYSINHYDVEEWEREEQKIIRSLSEKKTKILSSCSLQVFLEKQFQNINLFKGCSIDLTSDEHSLTTHEKTQIALKYLDKDTVHQFRDIIDGRDFLPLKFYLCKQNSPVNVQDFLRTPFDVYTKELNFMKNQLDNTKWSTLFLCILHNGKINDSFFGHENDHKRQHLQEILDHCSVNKTTSIMHVRAQLESLVGTYLKRTEGYEGTLFTVIHKQMFDFLCHHYGSNEQKIFIRYAMASVLGERTQLESLNEDHDQFKVIITRENEGEFFRRIVTDWKGGDLVSVLNYDQMTFEKYREKLISYIRVTDPVHLSMSSHDLDLALNIVCKAGYFDMLCFLLEHKSGVNHDKLLQSACYGGNINIVNYLINMGANVNTITPLLEACTRGHLPTVILLIDKGADVNNTTDNYSPLTTACGSGHLPIVTSLIDKGADVNVTTDNYSPLTTACGGGHLRIVTLLIDKGADVNKTTDKHSPLTAACGGGHLPIVTLLIDKGADVNKTTGDYSPLTAACEGGHFIIVTLLIDKGADVNKTTDKYSPLTAACGGGHLPIVTLLIDKGADVNKTTDKHSPLTAACGGGHLPIVTLLIDKGADVNKTTGDYSPLTAACEGGYESIVTLLVGKGADIKRKT